MQPITYKLLGPPLSMELINTPLGSVVMHQMSSGVRLLE